MDKLLLRIEEAAEALSLGRSKTYELIQDGRLRVVKIGRATRVPVDAVRDFERQLAAESTAPVA